MRHLVAIVGVLVAEQAAVSLTLSLILMLILILVLTLTLTLNPRSIIFCEGANTNFI